MRWYLALVSSLIFGCASPLTEARHAYDEARYPDAVSEFAALTPDLPRLDQRELFQYALYRGLSHLALGDSAPAERWLTLAKRMADQAPRLATPSERGRLISARSAMGHAPGD
jgi:hypothetical protein